ncbi:MAG: hypothetical protein H6604_02905 [Flavobacteriales bacterium]|nr:hypothetical protein [Flavobacteriales bacterium]
METLIIKAESKKIKALINFLKAFNISFEKKEEDYSSEFVKNMDKSIQQEKEGKLTTIDVNNLWK